MPKTGKTVGSGPRSKTALSSSRPICSPSATTAPADGSGGSVAAAAEKARGLVKRAQDGDQSAMEELRRMVRRKEIRLNDYVGTDSMTRVTMAMQVNQSTGSLLAFHAVATEKAYSTLEALKGPSPSPLEEVAAEAVILAWLDYQGKAFRMAAASGEALAVAAHREKALTESLKRLTMAVKMLDQLRRTDLSGLFNISGPTVVNLDAGGGKAEAITDVTPGGSRS
jgi:hypothetical protein